MLLEPGQTEQQVTAPSPMPGCHCLLESWDLLPLLTFCFRALHFYHLSSLRAPWICHSSSKSHLCRELSLMDFWDRQLISLKALWEPSDSENSELLLSWEEDGVCKALWQCWAASALRSTIPSAQLVP